MSFWSRFTRIEIGLDPADRKRVDRFLDLLEAHLQTPGNAVSGSATFTQLNGEPIMPTGVISTDDNEITLDLVYKDKKGNPGAKTFGEKTVALSADGIVSAPATLAEDVTSISFTPVGPAGSVHVVITAQGEETVGEQPILIEADIDVVPADAETGEGVFRPAT